MKKIFLALLILLLVTITGCKSKEKVPLEELYGKYDFITCVYVNKNNLYKKEFLNDMYKDKARYSVKESTFAFYETEDKTPAISLKLIQYKEAGINDGIEEKEVKDLLKKATTRYDIYKLENSQGYSFIFTEDTTYFLEFRKLSNNERVVWHVFEIEKRD